MPSVAAAGLPRRAVLIGLAGAAATGARPGAARASMPTVGWLGYGTAAGSASLREAFLAGMAELGYAPQRDFHLLERYGEERIERVGEHARALAALPADVIVAFGAAVRRVVESVQKVPVVYAFSGDPVEAGFTASLARPSGNATGLTYLAVELNGKRIELLKEILPRLARLAVLSNPHHPGEAQEIAACRAAAATLGLELVYLPVRDAAEIDAALARLGAEPVGAVVALSDILTLQNRQKLIGVNAARGVPLIAGWAQFAQSGSLFSYGPDLKATFRRLAHYVDRLAKGARPAELPIEQPARFELVLNLRTARALGLSVPPTLLARADEVIE